MQTKSEMINRIAELAKENAELKALVAKRDESVTAQAEIILKLKAENERLKEIKDDFFKQAEISHQAVQNKNKIIEKLETVMQEIKEIARKKCDDCDNVDGTTLWDDCEKICELPEIISIINKAEEE